MCRGQERSRLSSASSVSFCVDPLCMSFDRRDRYRIQSANQLCLSATLVNRVVVAETGTTTQQPREMMYYCKSRPLMWDGEKKEC